MLNEGMSPPDSSALVNLLTQIDDLGLTILTRRCKHLNLYVTLARVTTKNKQINERQRYSSSLILPGYLEMHEYMKICM